MTIEEKAKAYDEALERAKDYIEKQNPPVSILYEIFPELAESDERIRKGLIELVKYAKENCLELLDKPFNVVSMDAMLTWLEKQGEQKPTSDTRYEVKGDSLSVVNGNSFDYEKATITQKDFAPEEEMVGEAKSKLTPFDKKVRDFLFSFYLKVSDGMPLSEMIEAVLQLNTILFEVEQKQEWSEEDKEMLDRIDDSLEAYATKVRSEKDYELEEILKEEQSWLYSLKDRILPQPMQEWSEEDDYNLQCMIAKVTSDIQKGNVGRNNELIDWLKSLKDRMKGKEE